MQVPAVLGEPAAHEDLHGLLARQAAAEEPGQRREGVPGHEQHEVPALLVREVGGDEPRDVGRRGQDAAELLLELREDGGEKVAAPAKVPADG
eukprot:gene89-6_t